MWMPEIEEKPGPRYQAIADDIADSVVNGRLKPGDRLPPQRDLAWKLGLTVGTISRAYSLAEQRGLVAGEVGRGTFVQQRQQPGGALIPPTSAMRYDMGINIAPTAAQADALGATLQAIATEGDLSRLVPYMPSAGYPALREAAGAWIGRAGLDPDPEHIVLTCGAQHGLSVTLAALLEPADTLLTDALTYPGLIDMCRLHHLRLEPIPMDEDGMLPDALDRAASAGRARHLALNPTLQNPTTITMSEARRAEIVEIARRHDLTIIEDDVYGWMMEERPVAVGSLAPERTVFITSASKSFAPGLRAGWVHAPAGLRQAITAAAYATTVCQPPLMHEVAARWIHDGTADQLVSGLRVAVAARQKLAREKLNGLQVDGNPAGFHIMVHLPPPWRGVEFAEAALAAGIRVVPASTFAVGQTAAPHAVRASVTSIPDMDILTEGLGRLRDLAFSRNQIRGVI